MSVAHFTQVVVFRYAENQNNVQNTNFS